MATTSHGAENEVTPAVACPYLSLSAAHISWYKLIREMPFIDPLEALTYALLHGYRKLLLRTAV